MSLTGHRICQYQNRGNLRAGILLDCRFLQHITIHHLSEIASRSEFPYLPQTWPEKTVRGCLSCQVVQQAHVKLRRDWHYYAFAIGLIFILNGVVGLLGFEARMANMPSGW